MVNAHKTTTSGRALQDTDPLSFQCSDEQFGITRIPGILRIKNDYNSYAVEGHEAFSIYPTQLLLSWLQGKQKNVYEYFAYAQHTKYAVVPLHTEDEYKLFHRSVMVGGMWSAPTGLPDFDRMAAWWSSQADGKTIFYKLREHLVTHYKIWLETRKQNESMVASLPQRKKNNRTLQSAGHISHVLPAAPYNQPGVLVTSSLPDVEPDMEMAVEMGVDNVNNHDNHDAVLQTEQPVIYPQPAQKNTLHILQELFHLSEPLETSSMFTNYTAHSVPASSNPTLPAPVSRMGGVPPMAVQSAIHAYPATASTSTSGFVAWSSEPKRTRRRCAVCVQAGRSGYHCPGSTYREKCKHL